MAALHNLGVSMPVETAEFEVDAVFFDVDTRWSRGFLFRRDPSEPNTYKMTGKYNLPKKPE